MTGFTEAFAVACSGVSQDCICAFLIRFFDATTAISNTPIFAKMPKKPQPLTIFGVVRRKAKHFEVVAPGAAAWDGRTVSREEAETRRNPEG
jgi:hypothetical protein